MRLLRLNQVRFTADDRVYRQSPGWLIGPCALSGLALPGLALWRTFGHLPLIFVIFGMAGALLIFAITGAAAKKALRPTNWLVAWNGKRLLIKFRSYLNTNFDPDDPQVVELSLSDIEWIRESKTVLETPDSDGGVERERVVFLEICLKSDAAALRDRLAYEQNLTLKRGATWRDYPVSVVDDRVIRIEWKSARNRIRPGIESVLGALGQSTRIESGEGQARGVISAAGRARLDSEILQLAQSGRTMQAIKAARKAYGYDLNEARRFVNQLLQ